MLIGSSCMKIFWAPLYRFDLIEGSAAAGAVMTYCSKATVACIWYIDFLPPAVWGCLGSLASVILLWGLHAIVLECAWHGLSSSPFQRQSQIHHLFQPQVGPLGICIKLVGCLCDIWPLMPGVQFTAPNFGVWMSPYVPMMSFLFAKVRTFQWAFWCAPGPLLGSPRRLPNFWFRKL